MPKALDGKEIYGINPASELLAKKSINEIESLYEKDILKADGSLNELSYLIIRNLEQYKKASSYLWLNDIVCSMDDTDFLIFFRKEESGELEFKKTAKELMLLSIVKEYEFLWNYKEIDDKKEKMPLDIFLNKTIPEKEEKEVLYIKKEKDSDVVLYNIYYIEDESVYKYDALNEEVCEINPKEIRIELAKILGVKGE